MQSPNAPTTMTSTPNGANRATRPDIYSELDSLHAKLAALEGELAAVKAGRIAKTWYSRVEAAEYLRISTTKLDDLRGEGRLRTHHIDGRPIFHVNDLNAIATTDSGLRVVPQ